VGRKILILFLTAIFSLMIGFVIGLVVQNGGIAGIFSFLQNQKEEEIVDFVDKVVTVGENTANVYEEASASSEVIYAMSDGETATCLAQTDEWLKLEITDGIYGYAHAELFTLATDYTAADDTEVETPAAAAYVTPTVNVLDLYAGESTDYAIVTTVEYGAILELVKEGDSWSKVATLEGETGYVETSDIMTTDYDPDAVIVRVTNSFVNIRAEATTDSDKLGTLNQGEIADYLGEEDNFYHIQTEDGIEGYVSKDYTEMVQGY
jgi:SH3-like domain-containing protein